MISGGRSHVMFIDDNGNFLGIGNNYDGQLGNKQTGKNYSEKYPAKVPLRNIISVSCGDNFTVCANDNGNVFTFGSNNRGELGIHGLFSRTKPVKVPVRNVAQVFSGFNHTICLSTSNNVCGLGINSFGQLGIGIKSERCEPTRIYSLKNIKTVACGRNFTLFVDFDGYCYGCGCNNSGQLGLDVNEDSILTPMQLNIEIPIESVSCGESHSLLLSIEKNVYGMGSNQNGQLGLGRLNSTSEITQISNLNEIRIISCGDKHSIAIHCDGSLYVTGSDYFNQIGNSRVDLKTFSIYSGIKNVIHGVCHYSYTYVYNDEGLWYFGNIYYSKTPTVPRLIPPSSSCYPSVNTSGIKAKSARK